MKVVFLDVDGVLNSRESDIKAALTGGDLMAPSPKLVVRLLGIVQETDAKIVLTTSWRLDKTITWPFPVHDVTPRLDSFGLRSDEIDAWLARQNGTPVTFAILDDEPDAGASHPDRFVQTDPRVGLTADDAAKVIGLLT